MSHPNDDFIKRFSIIREGIEKRYLPVPQDIKNQYKEIKKIDTKTLSESFKKEYSAISNRIFNNVKTDNTKVTDWVMQITPFGIFYYSKSTDQWMDSFGKIAKTIEYLKKGYKASEISRIVGIHVNTITKVKKMVGRLE